MKTFPKRLETTLTDAPFVFSSLAGSNFGRLRFASGIGAAVDLVHIVLFALGLGQGTAAEDVWRWGIITCHSVLFVAFTAAGVVAWGQKGKVTPSGRAASVFLHLFYLVVLLAGAGIALVDQLVATAVTPYIVVSFLVPLVVQLPPRGPIVYQTVSFVLFAGLLGVVQTEHNVLLSNQVQGFSALGVGIFLSLLLWSFNRNRILQDKKIEQQTQELLELNHAKDRLFSIIAHDLRGPLGGLRGLLDLLAEEENPALGRGRSGALELLRQSSASVFELLENLLKWSKVQQNLIEVRPVATLVGPFLDEVWKPLEGGVALNHLTVRVVCPPALVCHVDPEILATVLRNLFSNATKFTPPGGSIELEARLDAGDPSRVVFECRDSGTGMTATEQENLFQVGLHSGMGLTLCRDFVRMLGGELNVKSAPGVGTRFWFAIPQSGSGQS